MVLVYCTLKDKYLVEFRIETMKKMNAFISKLCATCELRNECDNSRIILEDSR